MNNLFLSILLITSSSFSLAQKHDNIWLFGGGGGHQSPYNDSFGITLLDFSAIDFPAVINRQDIAANFHATNASFCDSSGSLLFYTNGERVYNKNHQVMENGNGLVANGDGWGYRVPQGALILPFPGQKGKFILIIVETTYIGSLVEGWNLFCNIIDINTNKLLEKRRLLIQDTINYGMITATKHANGRDWWFIVPKANSNVHYIGLVSPDGIKFDAVKSCAYIKRGLGQATFSPDGSTYIRAEDNSFLEPGRINIFDFDRCEGRLYNCRTKFYHGTDNFGMGCAVSPDSRYLYVMATYEILQYDLSADDIFATEKVVAIWDGTKYYNIWPVDFYLGQLGPDGRIYVTSTNSRVSMHYINFPNRSGSRLRFRQNGIYTPTVNQIGMPNFPNYRLGPLDDSLCDTLGIDNLVLCNWRWEAEDTASPLQITFTDLSAYEPETWHWTFGDGTSSSERYPLHTYAQPGVYYVCLKVSNARSFDTLCRWVNVGVSSINEEQKEPFEILLWPNPVSSQVILGLKGLDYLKGQAQLYDASGQLLIQSSWIGPALTWDLSYLSTGVYYYRVITDKGILKTGKILKI